MLICIAYLIICSSFKNVTVSHKITTTHWSPLREALYCPVPYCSWDTQAWGGIAGGESRCAQLVKYVYVYGVRAGTPLYGDTVMRGPSGWVYINNYT